jgi:hypothetical protein
MLRKLGWFTVDLRRRRVVDALDTVASREVQYVFNACDVSKDPQWVGKSSPDADYRREMEDIIKSAVREQTRYVIQNIYIAPGKSNICRVDGYPFYGAREEIVGHDNRVALILG